jgi:hypothetical protein
MSILSHISQSAFPCSPPYFLKQLVGGLSHILSSGLVHTQLVNFESYKAANGHREVIKLVECGFEYLYTTLEGVMLFERESEA